ncbi:ATP-binding protein [Lentzea flaviverrucosa]|uniref:Histidine kinase-like ATPase domain-containing protein n=1 Tax=Lentzea flaviverrucosa TaxID=200379 RepID=A0A1H9XX77_9PSEU|nr:ATP-binding protein [Lentzea flaviverrucosa]RDI18430.1 histidine kinase-like protein [Lentzea flaviverrucosa]SES50367.1 Histidine kinase-like ATPase domain-containing protein [Lentzea flaviverrucosa]
MANGGPADAWLTLELADTAPDTGKVRRWVESVLPGLHEDDLLDVLLVITELVSNVYDHARFPARLKLRKSADPCSVSIITEDASPMLPEMQPSSPGSVRGRGLIMVDKLSEQWGVARQAIGKRVWAVVPCPATP